MSRLTGYHRVNHRHERQPSNYPAFLGLAAALRCYKRLVRLTTQETVQGLAGNQGVVSLQALRTGGQFLRRDRATSSTVSGPTTAPTIAHTTMMVTVLTSFS